MANRRTFPTRMRTIGVGGFLAGALIVASLAGPAPTVDADVCETTVYEGCPARWDYLINADG